MRVRRPALGALAAAALGTAALLTAAGGAHADAVGAVGPGAVAGPLPTANPYVSRGPAATMHGDSESSDAYPGPGPGTGTTRVGYVPLLGACSTILIGSDGYPVAVCTNIASRSPSVYLLDPATAAPLATLHLPKGGLFGGVYAYLDDTDRLVVVDGAGNLLRVGHHRNAFGFWRLTRDSSTSIAAALGADGVVGLAPDWAGRVWFASDGGVIGTADPVTGAVRAIHLPAGETISNSISTAPVGTAVVSDHASYLLRADADGTPRVVWRQAYDRGPARKPGQLSHGSGATPTFFGPATGAEYLALTDNAAPQEHLLVYDAATGAPVCSTPVLTPTSSGTENSPIGLGDTVVVASTYGYPYPAVPADAGPAVPPTAPLSGGMTRVDVRADGSGCDVRWQLSIRSSAVPKLSLHDGVIYTTTRTGAASPAATTPVDSYREVAIDAGTGVVLSTKLLGASSAYDTLQLAGAVDVHGVLFQGTITGVIRIEPR